MRAREVSIGRTFTVIFDDGEDFYASLQHFCEEQEIRQGYIPSFIAGFSAADVVGTCEALLDLKAPVWSRVQLRNIEALGCGTIARSADGAVSPHIHVSVGLKEYSATAHTSHLLDATVQFLTEMTVVEIVAPLITREREPALYDVPLLRFHDR